MNKPIELNMFPEFYEIPNFSLYAINRDGTVINKLNMDILSGSINPAGYCHYRLKQDNGHIITIGRHRLLCIVFKSLNINDYTKLVVNHKNGIKGDDFIDNLEWSTPKKNVEHAGLMGLTEKCKPVSIRNVDTGEIKNFPSILECALYLNISKDIVNYRVKKGQKQVFPDRYQYRYYTNTEWFIPIDIENNLLNNGNTKKVLLRHIENNDIKIFDKLSDLANYLNVSSATITSWLNIPNQPVLPGFVQIKLFSDKTPWREVIDPILEFGLLNQKSVKTINIFTGKIEVFQSAVECAKHRNISTTALNHRLKSNGKKYFSDGFSYSYYNSNNNRSY